MHGRRRIRKLPVLQGDCSEPPGDTFTSTIRSTALDELKPGQCVITLDEDLMTVQQNLWLHNVFIKYSSSEMSPYGGLVTCFDADCNLWMTDVTLQGSNNHDQVLGALHVSGGSVYADGACSLCWRSCTFKLNFARLYCRALYPDGFVATKIRKIGLNTKYLFCMRVPSCRALSCCHPPGVRDASCAQSISARAVRSRWSFANSLRTFSPCLATFAAASGSLICHYQSERGCTYILR